MLPRFDQARDSRVMKLAKEIKEATPYRPMKLCLLEAIERDKKQQKINAII